MIRDIQSGEIDLNIIVEIRSHKDTVVWKFRKFSPTAKIFRQIDLQYNFLVNQLI